LVLGFLVDNSVPTLGLGQCNFWNAPQDFPFKSLALHPLERSQSLIRVMA
jgi:hypothetical protein